MARCVRAAAIAVALAVAGCGTAAPPRAPTTAAAPAPLPPHQVRPTVAGGAGHAAGYLVTQRAGLELYSVKTRAGRFRLVTRRTGRPPRAAGVPDSRDPFPVDLGTDVRGQTIAVYTRCAQPGCRLFAFDPATGHESWLAIRLAPTTAVPVATVDRGTITYALVHGHRSEIASAPLDGSHPPRTVLRTHAVVTAIDAGQHGLAYVAVQPELGAAHSHNILYLRPGIQQPARRIDEVGYGEEGGADIVSVSFSGSDHLLWGISGQGSDTNNYGLVRRLDLRTGQRTTLTVPGGGLISAAPDSANPSAPILLAYEQATNNDGMIPDESDQTLRHFPTSDFG
jgi:hypothetical protein